MIDVIRKFLDFIVPVYVHQLSEFLISVRTQL